MPYVLAELPRARLRIAGSGPFEPELRRRVAHAGLEGSVEIGAIPSADREGMATLMARASVVVLMSDYEAHPVSMMEALALGRPTLVATTSGLAEYVARGQVRGVAPDATARDLATALVREIRDPMERSAIAIPTWDDCAAALADLYRAVAGRDR